MHKLILPLKSLISLGLYCPNVVLAKINLPILIFTISFARQSKKIIATVRTSTFKKKHAQLHPIIAKLLKLYAKYMCKH